MHIRGHHPDGTFWLVHIISSTLIVMQPPEGVFNLVTTMLSIFVVPSEVARQAKASACVLSARGTNSIYTCSNFSMRHLATCWYFIICSPHASYSPDIWHATNWESLKTLNLRTPMAIAIFKPFIKVSYSTSLLVTWKLKPMAIVNDCWSRLM